MEGVVHVGEELTAQWIYPGEWKTYALEGMEEQQHYEVKVSYPASVPTRFTLQLEWTPMLRRRLNTAKIQAQGRASSVRIHAEAEGFSPYFNVSMTPTPFNLSLERVIIGLPLSSFQLLPLLLLYLVLLALVPRLGRPFLGNMARNGRAPT